MRRLLYGSMARSTSFMLLSHDLRPLAAGSREVGRTARHLQLSSKRNPYFVLGLPKDASPEQVKLAYYKLAMQDHPDRSSCPDAADRFAEIGAAYSEIMGESLNTQDSTLSAPPEPPPSTRAFPDWAHRLHNYLERLPVQLDLWLTPTYASVIYHHLRTNELAEALHAFEEMRLEGEQPTHAVYEMLIRGCTIAMRRVGPGQKPDHLTVNLLKKVVELWADMRAMGRKADYWTYNELIRAFGKAGAVPQAMELFEQMCGSVRLLPEERAFNSMYELCVLSGHYNEALKVFAEHEEMRKSLWKPRYTPVSFSLLLTAAAESGPALGARLDELPKVLKIMTRHGVMPRQETCDRLLESCLNATKLSVADDVITIANRAGHTLNPVLVKRFEEAVTLQAVADGTAEN
mmetsp:Transcript_7547/g.12816  ORF Transcript_7547/g.12816 Transcript_7547/m.12816 type:complete len:404 (+) Transcript_7547:62-1273(+)|eukprot:CAMPEP_0119328200 /NCGR_PEP_ID=MMETSP1333-20130426/72720_1 /TAXON_ID=418940 /ORGANISM="Scyphosphaera apsteinii, Strain RCC1455" /LENGTH=403 /DNA_ID=CAMNT_0007336989 /DNA_START=62 /DNA_END=1273 /DNA_ORIENTATION=-